MKNSLLLAFALCVVCGAVASIPAFADQAAPSTTASAPAPTSPEMFRDIAAAGLTAARLEELRRTRVLVTGATGRNGSVIAALLVQQGVKPRLMVRDTAAAAQRFGADRDWIAGDVTQPATLAAAVQGIDAIIHAVATNQIDGPNGTDAVDREGTRALIAAAKAAGVKRIVLVTGMLIGSPPPNPPERVRKVIDAKRDAERQAMESGLEYVILRPTGMIDRPGGVYGIRVAPSATYRPNQEEVDMRAPPPGSPELQKPLPGTISRQDFAIVAAVAAIERSARNRGFVVTQSQGGVNDGWIADLATMPRDY